MKKSANNPAFSIPVSVSSRIRVFVVLAALALLPDYASAQRSIPVINDTGDAITVTGTSSILEPNEPVPFFTGEVSLGNDVYYLQFANGTPFGFYSYFTVMNDPDYLYHYDMGFEYFIDAHDGVSGIYFYDFRSGHFFYTSPSFPFPYLYDFSLNTLLYYFPDPNNPGHYTSNPRYFYNFATGQIITL